MDLRLIAEGHLTQLSFSLWYEPDGNTWGVGLKKSGATPQGSLLPRQRRHILVGANL